MNTRQPIVEVPQTTNENLIDHIVNEKQQEINY